MDKPHYVIVPKDEADVILEAGDSIHVPALAPYVAGFGKVGYRADYEELAKWRAARAAHVPSEVKHDAT